MSENGGSLGEAGEAPVPFRRWPTPSPEPLDSSQDPYSVISSYLPVAFPIYMILSLVSLCADAYLLDMTVSSHRLTYIPRGRAHGKMNPSELPPEKLLTSTSCDISIDPLQYAVICGTLGMVGTFLNALIGTSMYIILKDFRNARSQFLRDVLSIVMCQIVGAGILHFFNYCLLFMGILLHDSLAERCRESAFGKAFFTWILIKCCLVIFCV